MSIQFGAVNVYQSTNKSRMGLLFNQKLDAKTPLLPEAYREVGGRHEIVEMTGKDQFALIEHTYGIQLPEALKALSYDEAMDQLDQPEYGEIKKQIAEFEDRQGREDAVRALSTIIYEYLGICKGRGTAADGTPINVINLDQQA